MTDFIDMYLRAADEAAMTGALLTAGCLQDETSGELYHPQASLLMIGIIESHAVMEGTEVQEWRQAPGYHANVRTTEQALAAALDTWRIYPATPSYAWAEGGAL
ncbi:hypothetical protein D6R50_06480 [Aeromonas veronii]|uniref:Uncharacterized protein n=1 Tax=Aeromonas veronii TaxID=654 RepID=A0A3A9IC75_AERVE|nr:hypothetical protein [Aeromonas veronii]RKJ84404.1 hypothetical protein D6R50_22365 [Aeromonas veronii]RKJ89961.1 hypothetical protein D6R50_12155 [Aeromonas veronii]RKJ90100.1 hypothetical protein D6R50_12940 [Aeromonas veronii]RKJ92190.1 hypothetical protein D6R50_06480 [Aeromonas veronii]